MTPNVLSNPGAGRAPARDFDEGVVGVAVEVIGDAERMIVNERQTGVANEDRTWRQRI